MFEIQVRVQGRWESIRPTGGAPYRFATREEAEATARMCYPGDWERRGGVRILDRNAPCPDRYWHHVGSTCATCGLKD
jgi:hypothetical protein